MTEQTLIEQLAQEIDLAYRKHSFNYSLKKEVEAKLEAAFREVIGENKIIDNDYPFGLNEDIAINILKNEQRKQAGITLTDEKE